MTRTDTHRPAEFDPTQYEIIGWIDTQAPRYIPGMPVEMFERAMDAWRKSITRYFPEFHTDGDNRGLSTCSHCGVQIRYAAVVEHMPSGDKLTFGEICVENRLSLNSRAEFSAKYIRDKAAIDKAAAEKAAEKAAFEADNADVIEFLAGVSLDYDSRDHVFVQDMKRTLDRKGKLSEAQAEATRKFAVRAAEFAAKRQAEAEALAAAAPLAEGRYEITGEVASVKWQDSYYGGALKILVKPADGNKVWGTVPGSIDTVERGQQVTFTATVERSTDDEHFGFFKRPTKAEVVS